MKGSRPYGNSAGPYAAALGELPVFVVGGETIAGAYFDMAAERRRGTQFAAMFLTADPRATVAYDLADKIVREGDYDRQRLVFDALADGSLEVGSRKVSELYAPDPSIGLLVGDMSHIPDVLVVRSWREAEMQRRLRGYPHPHIARWYPSRDLGALRPPARGEVVVVWAPAYRAETIAMHVFALHELHAEVVVVCAGGSGHSHRVRYVPIGSQEAGAVLQRALCVIDTTVDDPGWAQAFAACGFSVAAAETSGAGEVVQGAALYQPWSYRSIWSAALEAMARTKSAAIESPPSSAVISRELQNSQPERPERTPLVSAIIATYNREEHLRRSVRTLTSQTYENLEILIVNDGGKIPTGLPDDPRIRVVNLEKNGGVTAAVNAGLQLAKGEYVQLLADDDELYPDHVMRLVAALERTGAGVAHSNILIRYEKVRDGEPQTIGYNCSIFCDPLDRTEVYASSPVAGQAQLVRRSAYQLAGPFDDRVILSDQEMQIRLAEISDFVHVSHITGEWLVRDSGDQIGVTKGKDFPADLRRIFEIHPVPNRPYVATVRERTLRNVEARPPGFVFPPVISRKS